jgi:hypothetical protein
MLRRLFIGISIVMIVTACGNEQEKHTPEAPGIRWHADLEIARQTAAAGGGLVLLSFEAGWSPWTAVLHDSLYGVPEVVDSLAGIQCHRVEVDYDTTIVREFGVTLYPTIVLTDAEGRELGRMVGYYPPERFLRRLESIRSGQDLLSGMFRREIALVDDPHFLLAFGRMLSEVGMYDAARIRFDRAGKIDDTGEMGVAEEADFAMAETYMLTGEYREAGRRFRIFARTYPRSERVPQATMLSALCYTRGNYRRVAREILESYLEESEEGHYADFARYQLDLLRRDSSDS